MATEEDVEGAVLADPEVEELPDAVGVVDGSEVTPDTPSWRTGRKLSWAV